MTHMTGMLKTGYNLLRKAQGDKKKGKHCQDRVSCVSALLISPERLFE